jgi:hypothetical protein
LYEFIPLLRAFRDTFLRTPLNSEAAEMYFTSDPLAFMNERFINEIGAIRRAGKWIWREVPSMTESSLLRRPLRSPALEFGAGFFRIFQH